MTRRSTDQLIHDLAQAPPPVRPIPRLRSVTLVLVAAWLLAAVGMFAMVPALTQTISTIPWGDPRFVSILVGLALIGAGGTPYALADAVPGREGVARAGAAATVIGVALAAGGGLWALAGSSSHAASDLATGAACLGKAGGLAMLPILVAAFFLARGAAAHPLVNAGLAVTATVALGAVVVHVSCRVGGPLHALVGHALAPMVLGFALAVPVRRLVRRLGARS
ncbi:MAG: hypothetical protein ACE5FL_09615 [Myxococcota bacterium]